MRIKKVLSILLTVAMVITLLPATVFASPIGLQADAPNFVLGTNSDSPTVVGFAGYEWLVIGESGTTLTLLAKNHNP